MTTRSAPLSTRRCPRRASSALHRSLLAAVALVWAASGCTTASSRDAGRGNESHQHAASPATAPSAAPPGAPAATPAAPPIPEPAEAKFLTHVTQLTDGFDRAGEGYFSADMKWIIFQATPKGEKEYQMYVAPLEIGDGAAPEIGTPVRITPRDSRNTCGFFSPDGQTVIFASTAGKENPEELSAGYQREGGNYRWAFPDGMEIYAAKNWQAAVKGAVEGHDANAIVDLARKENRLTENVAYDAEGSYSPDGKWIVFTSRRSGDTDVWVMKSDGSHAVQLTNTKGYDGGPFFAPDGKRILYRSDRKGNDLLQVFVSDLAFDADGNITGIAKEHQLTDDANVNWGPYFHTDDKHIIYATSAQGHQNYELYMMKDDGSEQQRVTYCAGFDGLPVFSPDGRFLMWSAKRSKNARTQLFIARFSLGK